MAKTKRPVKDNPEQSKRFIDMAREVAVDESPEAFDRAFDKVIRKTANTKLQKGSGR